MKTPSTSSPSSSSDLYDSRAGAAGCFPAIIRRLVCGALEISRVVDEGEGSLEVYRTAVPPVPGLLARLMGLETLPATRSPERWPEFRDAGEFLLLSFCNDDDEPDSFVTCEKKTCNRESSAGKTKETTIDARKSGEKKKTRKKKKGSSTSCGFMADAEPSPQNSSPVSVLVRSPELDGEDHTDSSSPISDADDEAEPRRNSSGRDLSSELDFQENRNAIASPSRSADPWTEARRMVEAELQKSSRSPRKTDQLHEIAAELGLHILDAIISDEVISLRTCNSSSSRIPPASETLMLEEFEFSVFTMKLLN